MFNFIIFVDYRYLVKRLKADNDDVYGFFEPSSISDRAGNTKATISAYMLRHMQKSQKKIYIGAHNKG